MIASRLQPLESNSPILRVLCALRDLCVESVSSRQFAVQPNSFRHFPQSHLLMLTARHSCALPALSKVEGSEDKRSLAANPFRMRTSTKLPCKPFRFRTSKTQHLKFFRMCTYKKGGGGVPALPAGSPGFASVGLLCYRAGCTSNPFARRVMRRRAFLPIHFQHCSRHTSSAASRPRAGCAATLRADFSAGHYTPVGSNCSCAHAGRYSSRRVRPLPRE